MLIETMRALALGFFLLSARIAFSDRTQVPIQSDSDQERSPGESARIKVAVIGSGITGASAAYHIHETASDHLPVDISVFEALPRVGGHIDSVAAHGQNIKDLETGAAVFFAQDSCLKGVMG